MDCFYPVIGMPTYITDPDEYKKLIASTNTLDKFLDIALKLFTDIHIFNKLSSAWFKILSNLERDINRFHKNLDLRVDLSNWQKEFIDRIDKIVILAPMLKNCIYTNT